jgi:hypothetical protein
MNVPPERRMQQPFSFGRGSDSDEDAAHADALGADLRQLPTGLPSTFTVDDLARLIAAVDAHAAAELNAGSDAQPSALLDVSKCWTAGVA